MKINFSISFETGKKEKTTEPEKANANPFNFPWNRLGVFVMVHIIAVIPFLIAALTQARGTPVFFTIAIFGVASVFSWEYLIDIKKRNSFVKFFFAFLRFVILSLFFFLAAGGMPQISDGERTALILCGFVFSGILELVIVYFRYGE